MANRRASLSAVRRTSRPEIRDRIERLEGSPIRDIAESAMGQAGVIPLWFGESDLPTPSFIAEAAGRALAAGETFYAPNRGVPELVETIAAYEQRVHGRPVDPDRLVVTCAGMNALMMVAEMLVDPGDEVLCVTPVWPNFLRCVEIMGGNVPQVPLTPRHGRWSLDFDRLVDGLGARTRAIYLNSPNNPTGWMADPEELQALLDLARDRGLWIISDEVYSRVVYDRDVAPSFLDLADPEDSVIVVNSFSKSWRMTGWRLGWAVLPTRVAESLARLNEFNVAAPATPTQHAGIVAMREGEDFVRDSRKHYAQARDLVVDRLGAMGKVDLVRPEASFYVLFGVDGMTSSMATARDILQQTGVGMAPGIAFGAGGESCLRICYAKSLDLLEDAMTRLATVLD